MDTVYPKDFPFQKAVTIDATTMQGPGVTDMKGGLVVLWKTLEALEQSPFRDQIGWRVLINPDEEIGSPRSSALFKSFAIGSHLALLYEPVLNDGSFVNRRVGSANYRAETIGKAAHAGRDIAKGENAIYPLARWILKIQKFHHPEKEAIVNVGMIQGGSAYNIVPDRAKAYVNIRAGKESMMTKIEDGLHEWGEKERVHLIRENFRPPKPLDANTRKFIRLVTECGQEIGQEIKWQVGGGVTDGNTVASLGIPTIDSMGVRGGKIHTSDEFIFLDSLVEKTMLSYHLLEKLASIND